MSFSKPSPAQPGDVIGVCAPSGPVEPERLGAGIHALERLGFRVRVGDGILERRGFTAGDPLRRKRELEALQRDPEVRAIVCARGGAGALQLLPLLNDPRVFLDDPKPLIGYSDVTFLHLLLQRYGLVSFHGPMVARGLDGAVDEPSLVHAITGSGLPFESSAVNLRALCAGAGEGMLRGGCLSIVAAAAGTPWALLPQEPTILFLEDVGEPPYRIDRLLRQLRLSGAFAHLQGLVLGEMLDCQDKDGGTSLGDVVSEALEGLDVPVALGLPSGHTNAAGITLPLGVRARLVCDDEARFEILESGVE
jgi:muramoyltetrapeptide carboxypeptidase